jgi:hypothetical protein
VSPPVSPPVGRPLSVSGHGRFNTNGDGQVTFDLSNESLSLARVRGRRIHFEGSAEARDGTGNQATLAGSGAWNGATGYVFVVSVVDNSSRGRFRDTIEVTIRDATGATVFTSFGPQKLKQGDITVRPGDPA